jgi:hypothetical protein
MANQEYGACLLYSAIYIRAIAEWFCLFDRKVRAEPDWWQARYLVVG